jgi:hypothetical protein
MPGLSWPRTDMTSLFIKKAPYAERIVKADLHELLFSEVQEGLLSEIRMFNLLSFRRVLRT